MNTTEAASSELIFETAGEFLKHVESLSFREQNQILGDFFESTPGDFINGSFRTFVLSPALWGGKLVPTEIGKCFDLAQPSLLSSLGGPFVFENERSLCFALIPLLQGVDDGDFGGLAVDSRRNLFPYRNVYSGCAQVLSLKVTGDVEEPIKSVVFVAVHTIFSVGSRVFLPQI